MQVSACVRCAEKPQYGGTLRVELRATSMTLNPARWKAGSQDFATNERLAALVFDRLVALDSYGRFQPELATEWSHDGSGKRWQFTLRPGVKFSDGSALTATDVVSALRAVLPRGMQISATASGVAVVAATPATDLLELLSSGAYFIYRDDGERGLIGTGAFVLESQRASATSSGSADRLRFRFNEKCWAGRPFVDAIEVSLGVPPLKALLDLQLGKTDLGELSADTARRAEQSNIRLWMSAPVTLYALKFTGPAKSANERAVREALRLSVDRMAMARVLLQKQAEPAASFLPQWISGYAFLFEMESNLERAKSIRTSLPANSTGVGQALRVSMDAGSDVARLLAERVAVNARAAGLTVQVVARVKAGAAADGTAGKPESDAQLIGWRYSTISPMKELPDLAFALKQEIPDSSATMDAEARYAWEKRMMDEMNTLPLVVVPDFAGLDGRVRNWSAAAWGEWHLADVWIHQVETTAGAGEAATSSQAGAKP